MVLAPPEENPPEGGPPDGAPPEDASPEGAFPDGGALDWAVFAAVLSALATVPADTKASNSKIESAYEIILFTLEKHINNTP
jgi:hypothetical protein